MICITSTSLTSALTSATISKMISPSRASSGQARTRRLHLCPYGAVFVVPGRVDRLAGGAVTPVHILPARCSSGFIWEDRHRRASGRGVADIPRRLRRCPSTLSGALGPQRDDPTDMVGMPSHDWAVARGPTRPVPQDLAFAKSDNPCQCLRDPPAGGITEPNGDFSACVRTGRALRARTKARDKKLVTPR